MHILVPYRDRAEHLKIFLPRIQAYLPGCTIVVIEQLDNRPFNRGKLLNIGYLETKPSYLALHDVDKIPISADYSDPVQQPRQIAPNPFQTYSYFGGVTLFSAAHFEQVGGFRNDFWGWGGEDNELMFQTHRAGIRAEFKFGVFEDLPHPRPEKEFDVARWKEAQKRRNPLQGLEHCQYSVISRKQLKDHLHISVVL